MGDPAELPNIWHSSVRWNPYVIRTSGYSMTPLLPIFPSSKSAEGSLLKEPSFRAWLNWYVDKRMPGARTSAIARTRLIDDRLREVLATGIKQVVILGAGFDCRSIRLPELRRATVFEVDHFDTLRVKRNCLTQIAPFASSSVHYVGIDFNRESVSEALGKAGFDGSWLTVVLWEGVTNYLTEEAVDSILRGIADCRTGSQIIFTFVHSGVLDGSMRFHGSDRLIRNVAGLGEPWTFGIDPQELSTYLSRRGFQLDEDLPADEYRPVITVPLLAISRDTASIMSPSPSLSRPRHQS